MLTVLSCCRPAEDRRLSFNNTKNCRVEGNSYHQPLALGPPRPASPRTGPARPRHSPAPPRAAPPRSDPARPRPALSCRPGGTARRPLGPARAARLPAPVLPAAERGRVVAVGSLGRLQNMVGNSGPEHTGIPALSYCFKLSEE